MQPHILTIPDDNVYQELVRLAAAAGLHIADNGLVSKSVSLAAEHALRPTLSASEREYHLEVIKKGGDGKSIPDPLTWQREERRDRSLPGRD